MLKMHSLLPTCLLALACSLHGTACHAQKQATQTANRLTVMTYNVHHGAGEDDRTDYARLGEVIRRTGAGYVAVQEIDSVTGRSMKRNVLRELAIETGLYPTFAKAISYDGGSYGVGILSRERPLAVRRLPLPGREEQRVLLVAEFSRFVLGCTHFSLTEADRMASVELLRAEAQRHGKPFLLAGDWNDQPDSPFLKAMGRHFTVLSPTDKPTYPAGKPTECIDYIALASGNDALVKLSSHVVNAPAASDHRPVVATLQFKTPAEQLIPRRPYLQNPSVGGISILFQTSTPAHAWVEYGTDTLHLKRARTLLGGQAVCHDIEHKVRLDSLQPGQTYYYRVCAQEIIDYKSYSKKFGETGHTPFYRFTLPSPEVEDFTALVFNDLHDNTPTIEAFSKLAKEVPHDFIVFNGDCLPEPANRDHAIRLIHSLADAFDAAQVPVFFLRGNHEIRNAYSAGMPSLLDNPGGHTYGALSWGDTRFVMLDCGEDKPDDHWVYYGLNDFTQFRHEQADFLKQEIRSKAFRKAKRHVLIHHIPIWGNTDKYQPCTTLWAPILRKSGFDLNLCAHTHEYAKHLPGDAVNPPYPVFVGGGYDLRSATMMVLSKRGKTLHLRVINTNGEETDRLELTR